MLGKDIEGPGLMDYVNHILAVAGKAESGDLAIASRMPVSHAITLDSMFTELARRTALNMSEYVEAAERYGRLALKAQSNSRATLEALAMLYQPREQTVRHVHVNEGGQAVVADHFHNRTVGNENFETVKQSRAARKAGERAPLPSQGAQGNGVPITRRKRVEAMPDARGK